MNQIRAAALGERAGRILAAGGSAHVIGSTSRGIFLVTGASEVVFISYESWHGPLSINLTGSTSQPHFSKSSLPFNQVQQWDPVRLQAGRVLFSTAKIEIQTDHLSGWITSPPKPAATAELADRRKNVASLLVNLAGSKGWTNLFSQWLDQIPQTVTSHQLQDIPAIISQIRTSLASGEKETLISGISQILGKGEGLTPSGDDLVMGMLLVSKRYPALCFPLLAQPDIHQEIQRLSRQKTTWLGACLIESAMEGQADERLVNAMDGIVSAEMEPAEAVKLLQLYGSSSGSDAFLGMLVALQ
jgi:hypothetical protein